MNTQNAQDIQPQIRNSAVPGQASPAHADLASPDGKRLEPVHPDDVDADNAPSTDGPAARTRNPLADSPDDGE